MIPHSATIWAVIGLGLIIAEVMTSTIVLVFFGLAALVVAAVKLGGLDNLPLELVFFALLGLGNVLLFRKKILASFAPRHKLVTDTTSLITLSADVPADGTAPVQYQGALWTAVNESNHKLHKGDKVVIIRTEGIKLIVAVPNK